MTTRTIARMFDTHAAASAAVRDLEAAGFSQSDIGLVASGGSSTSTTTAAADDDTHASTGAGTGATIGTVLGGGAGLLAGLGALAIPGFGPVVAAGWLIAALTGAGAGAAAGGLLGGLTGSGVEEREAHVYAEGVRRGGSLVTVKADETRAAQAEQILMRHNPVDIAGREAEYREGGWTGYQDDERHLSSAPDGTPGNPPGTAATRAADDLAGTNVSGARPQHTTGAGMTSGAAATGLGAQRPVVDDGGILPKTPDGTPGNPPGTAATRGIDKVAGTNISGAHPENERGRS